LFTSPIDSYLELLSFSVTVKKYYGHEVNVRKLAVASVDDTLRYAVNALYIFT